MRETVFHKELAESLRDVGWWVYKVPDQPAGQMIPGASGGLRFNLPKPCDLLASDPEGCFVAIECKLQKSGIFTFGDRERKQWKTLCEIVTKRKKARAYFAINFRFQQKRLGRVNRTFIIDVGGLEPNVKVGLADLENQTFQAIELPRVTGGWLVDKL